MKWINLLGAWCMSDRWTVIAGKAVWLAVYAGLLAGVVARSEAGEMPHWAYRLPGPVAVPAAGEAVRHPVDAFVADRLRKQGLQPLGAADRQTLVRRVTLDLLGVPPTPVEIDAFLDDRRPGAWERLVDRLLASPRYGERWAMPWLDAARFADSNGYQRDGRREAWGWRDWVIDALNDDLPFDRFTIEQLAGDLLPGATAQQRIATGFHRNTMANVEAGVDPEEERVLAVVDRVNTTGTVWLGTTIECAQCHDHKYDPFSQREYYGLFALFNNTRVEIQAKGSKREFAGAMVELPRARGDVARAAAASRRVRRLQAERSELASLLDGEQAEWERLVRDRKGTPTWLKRALGVVRAKRKTQQAKRVRNHYRGLSADWTRLTELLKRARDVQALLKPATTLVMLEMPRPRQTRIFERGDFLAPGETVGPGTPAAWPPVPISTDRPLNRLDLARWLVDGRNPLTARVVVNRHWAELFGRGLVETIEDFGTRGARPTHPGLLDWLAAEWVRHRWSVKSLHRLLVTSATYRRRSDADGRLRASDPGNRWYARAARRRLPAELIRDNALAIAGLLSDKMHGPPVFPVQPSGVWNHIGVASNLWKTSHGEDLYRRGVYVYWRRTVPYPSFVSFDAPSREVCTVSRSQSNTPLQALTLLNDPVYVEAAAGLARRVHSAGGPDGSPAGRVEAMFRLATGRRPGRAETLILVDRFETERKRLAGDPVTTRLLMKTWLSGTKAVRSVPSDQAAALVAWMHVANVVLNLDEVITRE
ncbi:MAG: DUF1549 and DUF1553 domain-containing protein [Planctomycetales bacterium]|nr:DUF1549 and DUF1553 domain-containing protein [Planctomycetales bacterium]